MPKLLLVPLDDTVVFPTMDINLPVDVTGEERVLLVPRHNGEYAKVGTIARVADDDPPARRRPRRLARELAPRRHRRRGRGRASAGLRAEVNEHPDAKPVDKRTRELEREYRAVVEEILVERGADERVGAFLRSVVDPGPLADTAGYSPDLNIEQKIRMLETLDVTERLELALEFQRERLTELQVRRRIRDDVEYGAQKQQREYFLRQQMESIRKELGEDQGSVTDDYRTKIADAGMPDDVREQAERELDRLERMGEQSGESSMIRTYLDWLVSVPWSKQLRRGARPRPRA